MTIEELIDKGDKLYERSKMFPESDRNAFMAMIDLRNLWPEISLALSDLASPTPRSAGDTTRARTEPPRD